MRVDPVTLRSVATVVLLGAILLTSSAGSLVVVAGAPSHPTPAPGAAPSPDPILPTASFSTGENASLVVGKSNFTSSPALANASTLCNANTATFDAAGDLWVADYADNRVVEYVPPFSSSMPASLVLGQPNLTSTGAATTSRSFYQPAALAFDASGDLWVADSFNNRVLEFVPPFSSGMAADLVLGQASFLTNGAGSLSWQLNGPDSVAFDAAGDLWVAEFLNNRLVEYVPPFTDGVSASVVLGQSTFGPSAPGVGPGHLRGPFGIAFNATGSLWVGDANHNRIVAFSPPFRSGENASFVLGQPTFTSNDPGVGGSHFYGPNYLSFDRHGDLWVGDTNNNRVLEFSPPITRSSVAVLVLGQPNSTARTAHTSSTGMSNPAQAQVGPDGDVYVAEFANSRVVRFAPPWTNGSAADLVLGQVAFTTSTTSPTASQLGRSTMSALDAQGNLWVLDTYDNRVLEFPAPITIGESASLVLGQANLNDSLNGQTARSLYLPQGLAFDPNGDLWVADSFNNRVLEYVPPFTSGMAAHLVLGQPNFTANELVVSSRSLGLPRGIAFDSQGDLWVADTLFSRVLEFMPPFTNYEAASRVIGQSTFTGFLPGTSPTSLFFPSDVAVDANGTLYVSDTDNNRVLAYAPPFTDGMAASAVEGQTNFYSGGPGTGATALTSPYGIAVDPRGELWVADAGNNRVVRYPLPLADGGAANLALGQPTLVGSAAGITSGGLRAPTGVTVDPASGGLWVGDYGNSRLLFFSSNALSVATGSVTFTGGQGALDQTSSTGVALRFSNVLGASQALVVTQHLAGLPPGLPPSGFSNTSYYDVAVSAPPGASGAVQVCLTLPRTLALPLPDMLYWNGAIWAIAGSVTVSEHTSCGLIPLSGLAGTPIALELVGHLYVPPFPAWLLFVYATIGFIAVVTILIVLNARRLRKLEARRPPGTLPPPPTRGPFG